MLNDLEIINGIMNLKFDKLNNIYTIDLNTDEEILEFKYVVNNNCKVSIMGNENLKYGNNEIVITVYNDEESNSYYLYVYKENTSNVWNNINSSNKLDIKKEVPRYVAPLMGSTVFLILLLLYCFLFAKKKKTY